MDMIKQINEGIAYIEDNLCNEIDMDRLSQIVCVTKSSFLRFFSYMAGMTLSEYIRRRRLTLAAFELRGTPGRVIDIALKYGYDSADSFAKAFKSQHNVTPNQSRDWRVALKIYPPASFHIMMKGAKEMDFRMIEVEETAVYGASKWFDGEVYSSREALRHIMWSEECEDVPGAICAGRWNEAMNHAFDGVWYGIWQGGRYSIAREEAHVKSDTLERFVLPAGAYAAFATGRGGNAWEELPQLHRLIFDSWLPGSGYQQTEDVEIEVYHLWTDKATRVKNRYYEIWVPVKLR